MERILLVDDNKTLSKLLARKIAKEIENLEIDVAYSFAEAQLFMNEKDKYLLSILDLNLPDAPNGEIVDYALSRGLNVIVLTGSVDTKTKEEFLQKNIIDYVYKSNVNDVNYIFSTINRLIKNRKYKVIIAEDSMTLRNSIKNILKSLQFEVFAAAHGEEAINYFEQNPDVKLILSDYNMPVKNGLELLDEIRQNKDKNEVGFIAMTTPDANVGTSMFLKHGANDFIAKPFEKEEIICRVNNTIEAIENIQQIADFANKDFLTGAYNRRYFFDNMLNYTIHAYEQNEQFAIALFDIDFFKNVNDTYGHDSGDIVLKCFSNILIGKTKGNDIVARFGGEEFCVVLKNTSNENAVKFFVTLRNEIANEQITFKDKTIKITSSIGLVFGNENYTLEELMELADEALYRAKDNGRNRVEIANL
ncbi:bile resistance regulator [Campylobacter pinnipediorum subsp. caledonicus]|uniref:diguanylate cyclase n=1 Tax=Campylobacter pinnipediorum subsp. caledonicus TaxID=1874362 RepID=A0A1S6U8N2_9BACT|nr:response regulator [Campylobacter pinnipediorum]AQW88104.1 bile resistance regulator [Campylobacter pinnipediorum subsp. caledonicus]OPA79713.1 diguanylate cyclase response regulator [Campylobacter pinnipediorum subsp. pinnipediorum]